MVNENQIVIAAEINTGSPAFGHLGPMVEAAQRELQAAGVTERPGVIVADAGYWHQQQMEHITGQGIPVLVPPDAGKRKGTRPGWEGGPYAFMRAVLETELGKTLYRNSEYCGWRLARGLINATHNLLKLHTALQAVRDASLAAQRPNPVANPTDHGLPARPTSRHYATSTARCREGRVTPRRLVPEGRAGMITALGVRSATLLDHA